MFKLNDDVISQRVEEYFRLYDKNNNGVLEQDEAILFLNSFYQSMGRNINSQTLDRIRSVIDSDRDGKISKQELNKIIKAAEQDHANRNIYGDNTSYVRPTGQNTTNYISTNNVTPKPNVDQNALPNKNVNVKYAPTYETYETKNISYNPQGYQLGAFDMNNAPYNPQVQQYGNYDMNNKSYTNTYTTYETQNKNGQVYRY